MYTNYFNLKQAPFSIAPDPRYLFMSERHREALAHLLYGVGSGGGFVLLTGEIGAGKTTVCRCFIEQIPENCKLAYIFNPKLTVEELLLSVCDEFGIVLPPASSGPLSVKGYVDAINRYLLTSHAQGKNNVLVIDEAQNLSADVLEQLRLLTNLETNERKLLQIILIGQPELRAMLARPELEQLAQRVIARYHLGSLSAAETGSYIAHRLAVAGVTGASPIPSSLTATVQRLTHGVPRRINLLCDRALLGAYVENRRDVSRAILRRAAAEVFPGTEAGKIRWGALAAGTMTGLVITGAAAWQLMPAGVPAAPAKKPVPVVQAKKPAPLPVTARFPAGYAQAGDAVVELAALWGQVLPEGEPCATAVNLNLRCYQGRGGLYELRQLDRPAMLALHDGATVRHVVLAALDDDTATLLAQGVRSKVPVAALAARFDGSFTTFWSAPRGFRDEIPAGERGLDVDWIAARLAQVNGGKAPPANTPFDAPMREQLRAFQAAQHLKSDGVAGPRTFMRLNQVAGVDEPRLLAAAGTGK